MDEIVMPEKFLSKRIINKSTGEYISKKIASNKNKEHTIDGKMKSKRSAKNLEETNTVEELKTITTAAKDRVKVSTSDTANLSFKSRKYKKSVTNGEKETNRRADSIKDINLVKGLKETNMQAGVRRHKAEAQSYDVSFKSHKYIKYVDHKEKEANRIAKSLKENNSVEGLKETNSLSGERKLSQICESYGRKVLNKGNHKSEKSIMGNKDSMYECMGKLSETSSVMKDKIKKETVKGTKNIDLQANKLNEICEVEGKKETLSKSGKRTKEQITESFESKKYNKGDHTSSTLIDGNKSSIKKVGGKCECEIHCAKGCDKKAIVSGPKKSIKQCDSYIGNRKCFGDADESTMIMGKKMSVKTCNNFEGQELIDEDKITRKRCKNLKQHSIVMDNIESVIECNNKKQDIIIKGELDFTLRIGCESFKLEKVSLNGVDCLILVSQNH
jgi:hypothetical protein